MNSLPKRSTLSEANATRSADVFADIFKVTYQKVSSFLPDSWPKNQKYMKNLFLVDSTTITLFKDILKACGRTPANGKRKGGVKIHVGMHLTEETPSVVRITSAATNDKKFMSEFKNPAPDTI
ncbi:MAG: transposase, partial [Flavobacteriales bacterium]